MAAISQSQGGDEAALRAGLEDARELGLEALVEAGDGLDDGGGADGLGLEHEPPVEAIILAIGDHRRQVALDHLADLAPGLLQKEVGARGHGLARLVHEGVEDLVLRGVVVVKGALGHRGRLGYGLDGRGLVAEVHEELPGRVENPFPLVVVSHGSLAFLPRGSQPSGAPDLSPKDAWRGRP